MQNDALLSQARKSGFHLSISHIDAGWIDATVRSSRYWAQLRASFLSDAIGDLLSTVNELISGAAEARCSWSVEPGEYRWIFTRAGEETLLRILGFRDGEDLEPDDAGTFVFETTATLPTLAAVVAKSVEQRFGDGGDGEYEAAWGYPFPKQQLAALNGYLNASPA
jgi:hypothetical protein